jgi:hypothetical protein
MKKIVFFGIIILMVIPGVFAQVRLDLAIDIPVTIGITADTGDDTIDESINFLKDIGTFTFPTAMAAYQWSFGPVKTGVGLKGYSMIIESVFWPVIYAEVDLSPIVIHANIGGLGFLYFGLGTGTTTSSLIIPDFHIAYKFGKTFRLGIGAMALPGIDGLEGITPYSIYLTGRFSSHLHKAK